VHFSHQIRPVGLDHFDADAEVGGNFFARFAVGDQTQDFVLAIRVGPTGPAGIIRSRL
jgi:hypothetical protein